jgi:carbonic anhydrase
LSPGDLYVANNGHAVEVGAIRPDVLKTSTAKLGDDEYELKQIHMHVKSENTIDGVHAAMEIHFVHRSLFPGGVVLVVSVMYDEAPHDNLGIRKLKWGGLEPIDWEGDTPLDMQRKPLGAFDLTELLPAWIRVKKTDDYFYFEGSFSTPPCTEGVRWAIVRSRHFVSHAQLLTHPFRNNFRPTQPMFAGVVRRSAPCTGTCLGLNSTAPALPNVTQVMRTTLITGNNAMWLSGGLLLVCPDRFARAYWRGCALDAGVLFAGNPTGF